MIYGEHLHADEQALQCACGKTATIEVFNKRGCSCGWFCRQCSWRKRDELKRQEKLAKATARKRIA